MRYSSIVHYGAVAGVTGACHQLQMDYERALLIECDFFQGAEIPEERIGVGKMVIDCFQDGIKAQVAIHVYIHRVGYIPCLLVAGFRDQALCIESSIKLLSILFEDTFKLCFSRDQKKVDSYVKLTNKFIVVLPYKQWFSMPPLSARIRLQSAGHFLGSAYVQFNLHYPEASERKCIIYPGGLGHPMRQSFRHRTRHAKIMFWPA